MQSSQRTGVDPSFKIRGCDYRLQETDATRRDDRVLDPRSFRESSQELEMLMTWARRVASRRARQSGSVRGQTQGIRHLLRAAYWPMLAPFSQLICHSRAYSRTQSMHRMSNARGAKDTAKAALITWSPLEPHHSDGLRCVHPPTSVTCGIAKNGNIPIN